MAKQFFAQKLQDVEKKYIYEDYANRVGEIVIGTIHQVQRDNTFVKTLVFPTPYQRILEGQQQIFLRVRNSK